MLYYDWSVQNDVSITKRLSIRHVYHLFHMNSMLSTNCFLCAYHCTEMSEIYDYNLEVAWRLSKDLGTN